MILVYAVTPPRRSPSGGVRPPLRHITVGSIGAVVQRVSRAPKPTERALRRFDRVLASLAESTAAVLPARFGTAVADAEELAGILQARQQTLRRTLRHVRGRVQMTVRVLNPRAPNSKSQPSTPNGQRATPNAQLPTPNRERPPTGAEYLRLRAAARDVPGFAPLRAAVRRWVKDERVETRERVASVYHLVPRHAVAAYRRALEAAAHDAGLRIVVSGPWPPYAFATTF